MFFDWRRKFFGRRPADNTVGTASRVWPAASDSGILSERVTQVVIEYFRSVATVTAESRASQVVLEVFCQRPFGSTSSTPITPPNIGGTVGSGTNPAAGDSLCGSQVPLLWCELQLDSGSPAWQRYGWEDVPINFADGQAQPRILSISPIRRALSNFSGAMEVGGCTVDLYDADSAIRTLIQNNTLIRKRLDFYMQDEAGWKAGTTVAYRIGQFVVSDFQVLGDMTVSLTLQDRLGGESVDDTLRKILPRRTLDRTTFPALPPALEGKREPIPYGLLQDSYNSGTVQVWYVGKETLPDGNDYYAGLIAGCATWGVIDTFGYFGQVATDGTKQRTKAPDNEYDTNIAAARHGSLWSTNFSTALYRVINGKRYTMIYFLVGSEVGEAFASDEVPVAVDLGGVEDVGDGTGNVISSGPLQVQHLLTNFVVQSHETDADWLSIPTDNGYSIIRASSFADADSEIINKRMGAGYAGAFVVGWDVSLNETVGDWLTRLALGFDMNFGVNRHGQFFASVEAPLAASVRSFTRYQILAQSDAPNAPSTYRVTRDRSLLADVVSAWTFKQLTQPTAAAQARASAPGGQSDWLTAQRIFQDNTQITALGGTPLGEREFHYEDYVTRDILLKVPDSVAAHNLYRRRYAVDVHDFETDLCGLDLELGDNYTVTHPAGFLATARLVRLTAIELVPPDPFQHTFSVKLTGYDLTDLPTNTY